MVGGQLLEENYNDDEDAGRIDSREEAGAVGMRHTLNRGRV